MPETPDGPITVSPYAATDGPNDYHWTGTGLAPGLGADSPSLKRVEQMKISDTETLGQSLTKLSEAQQAHQREREAFRAEVEAFRAAQAAAQEAPKKGGKK